MISPILIQKVSGYSKWPPAVSFRGNHPYGKQMGQGFVVA
jgi:hypothetical protein